MSSASASLELAPAPAADSKPRERRALLFFLSDRSSYRRPLFSGAEVFCGPDTADYSTATGRVVARRIPAGEFDIGKLIESLPGEQQPDFVVVKADATGRSFPRGLACVRGPKVLLVGDTHHLGQPIAKLIRYAQEEPFDFVVFDHTRHHARFFAEAGLRNLNWIPALDYGYEPRDLRQAPARPLTFVGQAGRYHPYRRWVLDQVRAANLPLEMLRGRLAETADFYADSQITLNVSLNGDLNLRVFEALAAGGFLLTDELAPDSGLRRLFEPGRHLDTWRTPGELIAKIRHYLAHPHETLRIRREGQAEITRRHTPAIKLAEFYRLLDGGEPDSRYDLRTEAWWPRGAAVRSPGLSWRIAAYEALQEIHRTSARVVLHAERPESLDDIANLPRLEIAAAGSGTAVDRKTEAEHVLWWEEGTPASALAEFEGAVLLLASEAAASRPEPEAWGFLRESEESPVLRLANPLLCLERLWEGAHREALKARIPVLIPKVTTSIECVVLANYARMMGDTAQQHAALKRAIGLDRNNATALLSMAAINLEHGDNSSVSVILEEAARIEPLPREVERLRTELGAAPETQSELGFYLRAIGRLREPMAEKPRRILIATNLFPPQELGGYGRMMWEFARGLRERGHEVRVLTADQPELAKAPTADEAAMESCVRRTLPLLGEWRSGRPIVCQDREEMNARIRTLIARVQEGGLEFRPDVMLAGNLDLLDFVPVQVALAGGVPVLHLLGNASPGYARQAQPRSARYWIGPSSDWTGQALWQGGFNPARIETVYPGARIDRFFRFFLPDNGRLRICFAGLVMPFKGVHVLLDALARLRASGIDFTAEIAGDAPDAAALARFQDAVRATGLSDQVKFTGFLDRMGLSALFARSNVLVFPSVVPETFGISQVEAMAAGLAVVSSGTGGAREIIRHDQDGLLFTSGQSEDLAQQLLALARQPALLERLQRAAQARATAFSVEHSVRKIEQLVEELLGVPEEGAAGN